MMEILFYKSKRETVYNSIIYILTEIFKPYKDFSQNNKYNKSQSENDNDLLLDYISGLDSNMLRLLTNEVLLISLYLKRVVEALLKEDIKE
ncbi:MAG: type III-B CRISPR module-associated protein Cmr5 [Candidatus Methanomethylicia archaeon]